MLRVAGLLLIAKLGVGLFAFDLVDSPLTQLAQLAYIGLFVSFFYWAIVSGVEWILRRVEPQVESAHARMVNDDDRIDAEWLEQMMASLNAPSQPGNGSRRDD